MREISKDIVVTKTITLTETAISETLDKIEESKTEGRIRVIVIYKNSEEEVLKSENYVISDEKYELIMSEYPSFAPYKPKNEYRENDLWYMIDLIRNEQIITNRE